MARLRVFISSTYYDLRHVRASLENFVESLGHEPILSESGNVLFNPEQPLDLSCYEEMTRADVAVLIIGGRYGSESSQSKRERLNNLDAETLEGPKSHDGGDYGSVTRAEHGKAIERGVPVYTFVDRNVHAEYYTYQQNSDNESISYAHVDSVEVFKFLESIYKLPHNNQIQPFDRVNDIENWLREQWSGLLKDLLVKRQATREVRDIATEIARLRDVSGTLKRYLEGIISSGSKGSDVSGDKMIEEERRRLMDLGIERALGAPIIGFLARNLQQSPERIIHIIRTRASRSALESELRRKATMGFGRGGFDSFGDAFETPGFWKEIDEIRADLLLPRLKT